MYIEEIACYIAKNAFFTFNIKRQAANGSPPVRISYDHDLFNFFKCLLQILDDVVDMLGSDGETDGIWLNACGSLSF